jgi:hypothetical protein
VAAAFGSGAMFALLCGMGETDRALPALSYGLIFASAQTLWSEVSTNKMHLFDSFVNQNYLVEPPWSPRAVEPTLCQIYVD